MIEVGEAGDHVSPVRADSSVNRKAGSGVTPGAPGRGDMIAVACEVGEGRV